MPKKDKPKLSPDAVAFFTKAGREGARKRAKSLTPERRAEIARTAAEARWDRADQVYKGYEIEVFARSVRTDRFMASGFIRKPAKNGLGFSLETTFEAPGEHPSKRAALEAAIGFGRKLIET